LEVMMPGPMRAKKTNSVRQNPRDWVWEAGAFEFVPLIFSGKFACSLHP
jgi:hypothetical protein